eukprot:gnl/MRDRNA2_/MRDRNA2_93264_c0_seq1.p1 gnl/MRDRNA2_/MRDRNA2_93264_c0~~gnl/MRDRNA2_/MRDRNA2_93264_c0_seq1.p1  ORF type:complete len:452 (+),score=78.52 gnl/MRDRNA2_/MRDRNA2_93264_c0_seq1:78-1433(+)
MGCGCCKTAQTKVAPVGVDCSVLASQKPGRPTLAELRELNSRQVDEFGQRPKFGRDTSQRSSLRSGASCLDILEKNSVLVAVRIRPLNDKENNKNSSECLECQDSSHILLRRVGSEQPRGFNFDCVLNAESTQQDVFDRTAWPLLQKALEGYNGCLLAYGQTGSGKTYTMQGGLGTDMGVIPLLCHELFKQIEMQKERKCISVSCSFLEIYNEQLQDLLAPGKSRDLQIHQDLRSGLGMYVEGISEHAVDSSKSILKLLSEGQARRMVGQTNMNEHSSRSHSVFTLHITVADIDDKEGAARTTAKLHMVDLAGSERQKATGAAGDRLKEGAQINLSLSALGNVINALTESNGKRKHIPYRDSKITRLLQDSLGGNSYTALLCNVSPASINADETASSLRFAERAKSIENVAVINRDPSSARIAELLEENKLLKAKVLRLEAHIERLEEHYE